MQVEEPVKLRLGGLREGGKRAMARVVHEMVEAAPTPDIAQVSLQRGDDVQEVCELRHIKLERCGLSPEGLDLADVLAPAARDGEDGFLA